MPNVCSYYCLKAFSAFGKFPSKRKSFSWSEFPQLLHYSNYSSELKHSSNKQKCDEEMEICLPTTSKAFAIIQRNLFFSFCFAHSN